MKSEMTPDQRAQLAVDRANARRRLNSLRIASRALATWVDPTLAGKESERAVAGDRWLARLGEENVRRLATRMRRMAPWEQARAEKMRDAGASPWMLLKYLGANQDLVMGGPDCRDTIYAETIQYWNAKKQGKGRESILKVAIPVAVVATAATLLAAGAGYVATAAAPLVGLDPALVGSFWNQWDAVFKPVLSSAKSLVTNFDVVSAGFMFAVGAFWMWAHDSRVTQDLKVLAAQPEVPCLDLGIGFQSKSHRIQSAIRGIPEHQRVLLAHLSSTDLRAFLLGTNEDRIHLLRENRPPLINQFKSILAPHPRTLSGLLPTIRDLADVCLPKRWARAVGARHPGEIDQKMMEGWRNRTPDPLLPVETEYEPSRPRAARPR